MIKLETEIDGKKFSIETGRLAKQANGSVIISHGDTTVLVTAVCSQNPTEGIDFLPLIVDYQEMYYAAGRIPGGYFKREVGRPSEKEVLTSRLIDRPLRPRFPDGYHFETQIIGTVLSVDPEIDPDTLAITGASAALSVSDIPFIGPLAGMRVGRVCGELIANPTNSQLQNSELNITVAGTKDAIVMVEGGAKNLPEQDVLNAILFAHEKMQPLIALQEELIKSAGKVKFQVKPNEINPELINRIKELVYTKINEIIKIADKMPRYKAKKELFDSVSVTIKNEFPEDSHNCNTILKKYEKEAMRDLIVKEKKRIDGRSFTDIRPISCTVSELPRPHGSATFTRGETQVMTVVTLGSGDDEQRIETLGGEIQKNFMLHYNFPPYSVGEVRPLRGPGRRDIGHGALAERALSAIIPDSKDFLYTIRIVSEVLESNGSSSMATVCGGTLAMMDAGIPVKDMVAGAAMGLIKDGDEFIILSDILGDEDHLGDMDFKVAGTETGITALQMDIKISEINREILSKAMEQARDARLHHLMKMKELIQEPKSKLSNFAPRIISITVNQDKIKDLIGPGGKNIKGIVSASGVKIDIDNNGNVNLFAHSEEAAEKAIKMIKEITKEAEIGETYCGIVKKIMNFGAFVEILPGVDGLVHISQLGHERVNEVRDVVQEGDKVLVKVMDIDKNGKIQLSRKAVLGKPQ